MQRWLVVMVLVGAAAFLAGAPGCSLFESKVSDESINPVPYDKFKVMLKDDRHSTVVVDARSATKYGDEHITGAINIPLQDMAADDARLADAYNIVVYGGNYTDARSSVGAKKLLRLGYKNVFAYRDGLRDWKDRGELTEGMAPATQPATRPATKP